MEEELKKHVLKSGTTTVGVVCKDGIVIGADRRSSFGNYAFVAHKRSEKIEYITDKIAVATAGNVSDIQLLVKLMRAELRLKQLRTKQDVSVKEAANLFGMLTYENIRKFSTIIAVTDFLMGGTDSTGNYLYEISPDGSVEEHKDFVSQGSGMVVAYGVLEDSYKEGLSTEEGVKLVVRAINAAMQRDLPTGSGMDVVVIDSKGIRKVVEEEVKQIVVRK